MRVDYNKVGDRWMRAEVQDITIMVSQITTDGSVFARVKGTSGDLYCVDITAAAVSCTCMDFENRFSHGSPVCKHILCCFMHLYSATYTDARSIMQDITDGNDVLPNLAAFKRGEHIPEGSSSRRQHRRSRRRGKASIIVVEPRLDSMQCSICLEDVAPSDGTFCGKQCGKVMHKACIQGWLRINRTCPLCRETWVDGAKLAKKQHKRGLEPPPVRAVAMAAPLPLEVTATPDILKDVGGKAKRRRHK